jgi:DNA helicase IV
LQVERERVAFLYGRLDAERTTAAVELDAVLRDHSDSPWQREVAVNTLSTGVNALRVANNGLCFGRIDDVYVGRVGLFDEEYEPLLTDWRAPAARPFYTATGANPGGVVRRRHFHTRNRELIGFHDDVLADALNSPRDGVMRDIVATIQADQGEIIRLAHPGVLVIQGGPGTGKTAVALHRVAHLLCTHRERLSRRGVLIVGPNPGFLTHIGEVLPSPGETDVVFATPGELLPGLRTTIEDVPDVARVKGSLDVIQVLTAALAARQEVPTTTSVEIALDDVVVSLDRVIAERARDRARATGLPHNPARAVFRESLLAALTEQAVRLIDADFPPDVLDDIAVDVRLELSGNRAFHAAVESLWPLLTAQRFLADFYRSLPAEHVLFRADGDAWTVSDAPLLDEAVELLGSSERVEEPSADVEYARGVLQILDTDSELAGAVDPARRQPVSVRSTGVRPWLRPVAPEDLADAVACASGAVIVPEELVADFGRDVLTPRAAKGLEFDDVVIVEPGRYSVAELYVALTRATQRLGVIHTEPLPPALSEAVIGWSGGASPAPPTLSAPGRRSSTHPRPTPPG